MENNVNDQDKIWVNLSRTIPLKQYENIKIEVGASYTLKPTDYREEEISNLADELFNTIVRKSKVYRKAINPPPVKIKRKSKYDDMDAGDDPND